MHKAMLICSIANGVLLNETRQMRVDVVKGEEREREAREECVKQQSRILEDGKTQTNNNKGKLITIHHSATSAQNAN